MTSGPTANTATRGIFTAELLERCVSCGYCLSVCPTYALTKDEQSSPRGRISLMRALETGRLDEGDPTLLEQASQCLGCRACEPVCPAGVKYGELLEEWRDHQWRGRHRPPLASLLMLSVRWELPMRLAGKVRRHAVTTPEPAPDTMHLMLGCFERGLYPSVSKAAASLVENLDIPAKQGCCGALHSHNGDLEGGRALARQLGEDLPGVIVTTAGGCASHLADNIGRDRVREISQVLEGPTARTQPELGRLLVDGRPLRACLQDSCHLRNGLGVAATPRAVVARVADYKELPGAGSCCGAAGSYSLLRPKDSKAVLAPKLEALAKLDVDAVVVVNPICYRQVQSGLRRTKTRVATIHLAELADAATPDGQRMRSKLSRKLRGAAVTLEPIPHTSDPV